MSTMPGLGLYLLNSLRMYTLYRALLYLVVPHWCHITEEHVGAVPESGATTTALK